MTRATATILPPRRVGWIGWGAVCLLLLLQGGAFREFALREVVWSYPPYFDQDAYLEQSYQTYDRIVEDGVVSGIEQGMGLKFGHLPLNAAGATLHLQAALLYLMTGPSRLSAISLNFIYFAILQLALVRSVRWLSGRWSAAFLALGLLLTTETTFYFAGGLFDFRLDFIAFCLMGVFLALVVRSRVFYDWRWSAAAGLGAAVLGALRFITLVYLLVAFVAFLAFLLVQWLRVRNELELRRAVRRRGGGVLIAGAVIALIAGPVLWHHRSAIESYYVAGHVQSSEKQMRAREAGTTTLRESLEFYPSHLIWEHAGKLFLRVSAIVLGIGILALFAQMIGREARRREAQRHEGTEGRRAPTLPSPGVPGEGARDARVLGPGQLEIGEFDFGGAIVFAALSVLSPLAVLTADTAKAPQVAGIMVMPLVWLTVLAALWLMGPRAYRPTGRLAHCGLIAAAVLAMAAGICNQFAHYSRRTMMSENRPQIEKLIAMYDRMAGECQKFGWGGPGVACDCTVDYLYHKNLTILAYERHGILLATGASIGRLEAYPTDELFERLRQSDFALITQRSGPRPSYEYPFDVQMEQLHPQLLDWCRRNMSELEEFQVFDRQVKLFERPGLRMQAAADGWITRDGLELSASAQQLRRWPVLRLRGRADFKVLGRVPNVSAVLLLPGGSSVAEPARIGAAGTNYEITIDVDPARLPPRGMASLRLDFDASFVPKQLGINPDTRQLVMPLPSEAVLVRQGIDK